MEEIVGRKFLQHCGDTLEVIKKSDRKQSGTYLYLCQFQKYPCEIFGVKKSITNGQIVNPQIEQVEFVEKLWIQNCGDTLKIIKKTKTKQGNTTLFECEFIKYPYKTLARKETIIKGNVNNPIIEQVEFINKLWFQNCGDILKVVKKSEKKQGVYYLWECEFQIYHYKIVASKRAIINGEVLNPNMPWLSKIELNKYILNNFKIKPTIQEIANSLNISRCYLNQKINEFQLSNLINYNYLGEENQVKEFINSVYKEKITKYSGKKEDNYYEIDIYLPELKKGIEYNGSNWHEEGNPNNLFSKSINYHKEKQEFFAKKGIDILFIWDYEWFEDFPKRQIINEQTKQKIRDFLQI